MLHTTLPTGRNSISDVLQNVSIFSWCVVEIIFKACSTRSDFMLIKEKKSTSNCRYAKLLPYFK